jgi:hypothetical protein
MASASIEDASYTDKEEYLINNYKKLIPRTAEITFDIWDSEKEEIGDDILYGRWNSTPIHLNTELTLHVWIGSKCYKVVYDIYWKIDSFPYLNYYECSGSKCRRNINLSFDHWCASCYGEPDEWEISRMVEICVKGSNDDNIKMTFGRIDQFIEDVDIISYEEIESPDELLRTQQIMQKMESHQLQLEEAERKIIALRERNERLYAELGFESKEEMEKFMSDAHKRAAADLVQRARAKLDTLSVADNVVSKDPVSGDPVA